MKRTLLGLAPLTLALATLSLACSDDSDPGTEAGETGDGDGDGDMTGDGDGDTTGDGDGDTTGDGDGDMTGDGDGDTTGDGDGDPGTDADGDGIPDASDNCPDDPNPNQLDFDGNGVGNVCDVQVFSTVSGTLNTTASASAVGNSCNIPIPLMVTGGEIQVQLDDDAAVAGFEIVSLEMADILDQECDLGLATANVSIKDFGVANNGDPFPVSVAHSVDQHDAGSIAGDSSGPHPMLTSGTMEAQVGNDPAEENELMLEGSLPIFTSNITDAGAMGTLAWADGQFVLASDVFTVPSPLGFGTIDINFELRGLNGSLVLMP
ncbi:MAG: hypothetical protein R6X02_32905 [Enhygromyxa sp.]